MGKGTPTVLLLDGDYDNALSVARELSEDLDATILGVGTSRYSRLLRSRYCDVELVLPSPRDSSYGRALLDHIHTHQPQIVLPISYEATAVLQDIRSDVPSSVSLCIPSAESFRAAEDKVTTLQCATDIGLEIPTEYTDLVTALDDDGRPDGTPDPSLFPLFLKARKETGRATTAFVADPGEFWEAYDRLVDVSPDDEVLVQEYVDGSESTYGCGLLFLDDDVELLFSHEELRAVPRRGGSGTHLRILRDPYLESKSIQLLREVGWNGVALVEFKQRADGTFVLMEINPKFWASYALASTYGYRFASTMVAHVLDLDVDPPIGSPVSVGEMVFPLRELYYYAQHRDEETLPECLASIVMPKASWDVDRTDLGAWLTPPAELIEKLPGVESPRETTADRPDEFASKEVPKTGGP